MNIRKNFNIINRIASGYVLIIIVVFLISVLGMFILEQNNNKNNNIFTVDLPVLNHLKDFRALAAESKKLTGNWIYLSNQAEKKQLKKLHLEEYESKLKNDVLKVVIGLDDQEERESIEKLLKDFDTAVAVQKQIMGKLTSDEDYASDVKVDEAISLFEKQMVPQINAVLEQVDKISTVKNEHLKQDINKQKNDNNWLSMVLKALVILVLITCILIYFLAKRVITEPLKQLKNAVLAIGRGAKADISNLKKRDSLFDGYKEDEIGQMAIAVDMLSVSYQQKADFATEIGKGNYKKDFSALSEEDTIGIALMEMRDKLNKNKDEDEKRNWVANGIALFADLLREEQDNFKKLGDNIISKLVKYTKCNQGSLFIISDNEAENGYLEQLSCYAWERKKYSQKRIPLGEGLLGQTVKEKDHIYMTDIPDNYVNIISGLGDANPKSILLIPMQLNDEVFGVIELASFNTFEKYEIDFIKKVGESIAATLKSTRETIRTKRLLSESQSLTEAMKAQEEEMRQNMEEMAATQEEMLRKEKELQHLLEESKAQEEELRQNMEEMQAVHEEMEKNQMEIKTAKEELDKKTMLHEEQMQKITAELELKNTEIKELKKKNN